MPTMVDAGAAAGSLLFFGALLLKHILSLRENNISALERDEQGFD